MKTDRQLQQDVSVALLWEPALHAARIAVAVKDGVVTLAGQIDNDAQKCRAERAAQRVAGIRALSTALRLRANEPPHGGDAV